MSTTHKIVITGPFNAGKTQFIITASDRPPILTEEQTHGSEGTAKAQTTVALDYGKAMLDNGIILHLFGTPGQKRFAFVRDLLSQGMDGFVLVIDSADRQALADARAIAMEFESLSPVPGVIAANKADLAMALGPSTVRAELGLGAHMPVVPCSTLIKASVRDVLATLVRLPGFGVATLARPESA